LLVPAVQKVREAAQRTQCTNNLKQMALGLHGYHDTMKVLPQGCNTTNLLSFHVYILPYVEQQAVFKGFNLNAFYTNATNLAQGVNRIPVYLCPAGSENLYTQYGTPEWAGGTTITYTNHYYGIAGPKGNNPTTN